MIAPTIGMAIYLAVKSRHIASEFLPNLAVCCWITANAVWMLGEFFDFNHTIPSLVAFSVGLLLVSIYFIQKKHRLL
jgi:hypothetical protein